MEKFTLTQKTLGDISQLMDLANKRLGETPEQKFERTFYELILQEIEKGVSSATDFINMIPGYHEYTYRSNFPLPVYEALTEEMLLSLEQSGIYLSKNDRIAKIQIVFHF